MQVLPGHLQKPSGNKQFAVLLQESTPIVSASQTTLTNSGQVAQIQPLSGKTDERITKQLVTTIVEGALPLLIAENIEFMNLLGMLQPRYEIVWRRTLQRRFVSEYQRSRSRMMLHVSSNVKSKVYLDIDG